MEGVLVAFQGDEGGAALGGAVGDAGVSDIVDGFGIDEVHALIADGKVIQVIVADEHGARAALFQDRVEEAGFLRGDRKSVV